MGPMSGSPILTLVVALVTLVISAAVSALITYSVFKKKQEQTIGNAEVKAREILDEALKNAEEKKREGLLEVKEESIKAKNELDREIKDRRAEEKVLKRSWMLWKSVKLHWQQGKKI